MANKAKSGNKTTKHTIEPTISDTTLSEESPAKSKALVEKTISDYNYFTEDDLNKILKNLDVLRGHVLPKPITAENAEPVEPNF
ncbi:MAG: hypothetical protein ACPGSJ_14085, partial [Pseudoalteromonas spongiae]